MFKSSQVGAADYGERCDRTALAGLLALLITGTNFSVSSGVGFLALFGVSVQTGVIMLEYINQLASAAIHDRGCGGGRRSVETASDHDDDAGGDLGIAAGSAVARDRIRFAAAVRDRDCGRIDFAILS